MTPKSYEALKRGDIVLHSSTHTLAIVGVVEEGWSNYDQTGIVYVTFWSKPDQRMTGRAFACQRRYIEKIGSVSDLGLTY